MPSLVPCASSRIIVEMPTAPVLVATTERPAGYEVKQTLGQVFGVVVRSRGLGGNIMAGLALPGGGGVVGDGRLGRDTRRPAGGRPGGNARLLRPTQGR